MKNTFIRIINTCKAHPKKMLSFLLLIFLVGGFFLGRIMPTSNSQINSAGVSHEYRDSGNYTFINPLIECEPSQINNLIYGGMENSIEEAIAKMQRDDNRLKSLAVYFRDLNNGPWFGYNEHENFSPASLMKVPVMIAYYKKAATDSSYLTKKVIFNLDGIDTISAMQNIRSGEHLDKGAEYTLDEIIDHMIRYSDNEAAEFLIKNLDIDYLYKIYLDFGISVPYESKVSDFISVKEYSSFFRVLYNASYLGKEMSEKALKLLSTVEFNEGIVAGVPSGVAVSHKFGERVNGNYTQLHDCGIVYYPDHPYLLCIMARGTDFDILKKSIKKLSETIYYEVQNKKNTQSAY